MARRKRRYIYGSPHLTRQRGKKTKYWYGLLDGEEISLGTADADEADRRLKEFAQQRVRTQAGTAPPAPVNLSTLALRFAEHCLPPRHTTQTAASYERKVTAFVEWTEKQNLILAGDVTLQVLSAYIRHRSKGAGGSTVNRDISALASFFAFAVSENYVALDPFEGDNKKKLRFKEPRPKPNMSTLSPEQVDAFLDKADEASTPTYAALFRLTAGCALRIDEARHLESKDVGATRGYLTVTPKKNWTTKGYRYRDIPVSEGTKKAAQAFIATRHLARLDDKTVWKEIQRLRSLTKDIPKFSMHDLRRAWASAVYAKGASLKQVSVWLGHSSVAVTERYIRKFEDQGGHEFLPR